MKQDKDKGKQLIRNSTAEFLIFTGQAGEQSIEARYEDETIWLTQQLMAELFQVKPQNITMHLKSIYAEGELQEVATCKEFLQVQTEGARQVERKRKFYNSLFGENVEKNSQLEPFETQLRTKAGIKRFKH